MNIKGKPYNPRKTREQWKQLITEAEQSSQPTMTFCEEHAISYQSFMKWRSTFRAEEKQTINRFLDITPTQNNSPISSCSQAWDIELALGDDVVLRIRNTT